MTFIFHRHNSLLVRYNKLAIDTRREKSGDESTIDEVDHLVPITSKPLVDLRIKHVAVGISHSAFLTGKPGVTS